MVGRYISKELKEMALSMSLQGIHDSEIHEYTGISVRSIKRLRSTFRQIGEVSRKPVVPGRQCNLTYTVRPPSQKADIPNCPYKTSSAGLASEVAVPWLARIL